MEGERPFGPGFKTPEEAAIAGWPVVAKARVVRSEVNAPDQVDVIVDTDPHYLMRVRCFLFEGLWYEAAIGDRPTRLAELLKQSETDPGRNRWWSGRG